MDNFPKLPMVDTKGRYLNGVGGFNLSMSNGTLFVRLTSLEVKGKPAPPEFLASFQSQNLAASANGASNSAYFDRIESLQVTNSTLVIQPKSN